MNISNRHNFNVTVVLVVLFGVTSCVSLLPSAEVYTLYRNSAIDESAKYHVATFDASDGADYNKENCEIAARLFQTQPFVTTRFWCEQGRTH